MLVGKKRVWRVVVAAFGHLFYACCFFRGDVMIYVCVIDDDDGVISINRDHHHTEQAWQG